MNIKKISIVSIVSVVVMVAALVGLVGCDEEMNEPGWDQKYSLNLENIEEFEIALGRDVLQCAEGEIVDIEIVSSPPDSLYKYIDNITYMPEIYRSSMSISYDSYLIGATIYRSDLTDSFEDVELSEYEEQVMLDNGCRGGYAFTKLQQIIIRVKAKGLLYEFSLDSTVDTCDTDKEVLMRYINSLI